jgi:SOS-response transcriptional repressor LexA
MRAGDLAPDLDLRLPFAYRRGGSDAAEVAAMTLTKRQKEILDFIEDGIRANGYAPTLEEIGTRFGLRSLATVHKHVSNLEAKGLVRRRWNHSRAIELVPNRKKVRAIELPPSVGSQRATRSRRSRATTASRFPRAWCVAARATCCGSSATR